MGTEIYLDTARLGRMCPGARLAERDFGRLVSRLGCSLYLERFLKHGFPSLPKRFRQRLSHLNCWPGIECFRTKLGDFVGQAHDLEAHLFGLSSSMIRFAAECMFDKVSRVLTTDLVWPPYLRALKEVAESRGAEVITVLLREKIFDLKVSTNTLVEMLADTWRQFGCDGLFLSDISFLGFRLPAKQLLRKLGDACKFSVIDGAQALNHRPVDLQRIGCDLYLAGTQKWFRSYHPMRAAFVGNSRYADAISGFAKRFADRDPLLNFTRGLAGYDATESGETVNLAGLLSAAGALHHADKRDLAKSWEQRRSNAMNLAKWFHGSCAGQVAASECLFSGIMPLKLSPSSQKLGREHLNRQGLVASVLPNDILRLSMPAQALSLQAMTQIVRRVQNAIR